jgi:methyl-accepting chemotaxis protein/methyl-accepting chemotaxis protein-1 (serine sensor receptor)
MLKMTIGNRMLLSTAGLVTLTLILGVTAWVAISDVGERLSGVLGPGMKKQMLALEIKADAEKLMSLGRAEMVRGYMRDLPGIDRYHREFATVAESIQAESTTLDGMVAGPDAKQAIDEIRAAAGSMAESEQEMNEAIVAGDMAKAGIAYETKMFPANRASSSSLENLLRVQAELLEGDKQEASAAISNSHLISAVTLLVCLGLGVAVLFGVRGMNRDLLAGVTELAESIGQIASAASQVAASSQSMAQGASEQAATIEETSSASTEINSMAQRNTENSRSTAEIVTGAQVRTEQTNTFLKEMVEAMDGITSSSQKISKIIKVIDEIAFQTNILALNAAVEAARAGSAGMGFAVVADEVRNLAQRSAQAAKDTAELIEESIERSNGGKTKVDQVAGGIHTVTDETAKIKLLVDEINLGSVEQSRGIDQISRSITEMEHVTQSNAASAQESAAAAAALSSQAQGMRAVVERLSEMVGAAIGAGAIAPAHRPAATAVPQAQTGVPVRGAARYSESNGSPARGASMATARSSFPMDDDFKEF